MSTQTPTPASSRTNRIAVIALLAGAIGIAFAPIFVRLSEIGPVATAFWRLAISLPFLMLWLTLERRTAVNPRRPSTATDYWGLTAAGLFFAADLAVWHWSITLTSVANATLLANFSPLFVTFGAWFLFKERVTANFLAGLIVALFGAIALMGSSINLSTEHLMGDALGLGTSIFYAGYLLSVGRLRTEFSTATIMTWSGAVTALALLPIALVLDESLVALTLHAWAILLGLAVVSHVGGQSLIAYALAHLPTAFSSVSLLLQPAAAAVLAWILLDEPLGPWQAAGAVIVLIGIAMARRGSRETH